MYLPADQYVPQFGSIRRPVVMWLAAGTVVLAVMALVFGAPVALATGHPVLGQSIYGAFGHVCHQIPDRSFFIAGHQLAICARCTGLYAAFAVTVLAYPLIRSLRQTTTPERKWLFIAALPLTIDVGLTLFGIWDNTHLSRFATGALLGVVSVFYVMPGLMDLAVREWTHRGVSRRAAVGMTPGEMFTGDVQTAPSDYSAPHRRI